MENNKIEYKWKKLFASMRFDTDEGIISLTPEEQQELIDDISSLRELKSDLLNLVSNRFDIGDKVKDVNHVNLYGTIVSLKATVKWDRTGNHTDEEFDNLNDC